MALWPLPKELSTGSSTLKLGDHFNIKLSGVPNAPKDLEEAMKRTEEFLSTDKLQILEPDRGASYADAVHSAPSLDRLTISLESTENVRSISDEAKDRLEDRQEGYTLEVPDDGSDATLTANSTLGLFRGLSTFSQLWYDLEGKQYSVVAPISIKDSPAYVSSMVTSRLSYSDLSIAIPWLHA